MIAQLDPLYIKMRPTKAIMRIISHVGFQGRPLTTRARWINYAIAVSFNLVKHMPQIKQVSSPIFILGTGRSGTTILGKVLSMHHDVGWLNEPKLLWHTVYPNEDLIGSYSRGGAHYRLGVEDVTDEVRQAIHHLYGFYLTATGTRRVLDKYPEMIFRAMFVRSIFQDVKFIFLVRNGWDTVRSIELWSERNRITKNGEVYDWWGVNNRKWQLLVEQIVASNPTFTRIYNDIVNFSRPMDMAAVEWIATMREGLQLMETIPQQIHLVHFEELTRHPRKTLEQVAEFCDLSLDEIFLAYASKILKPVPSKGTLPLHSSLQGLFEETMRLLGYNTSVSVG